LTYKLLPELYGENSCTHCAHLLFHLTKFVCLWGPLFTHSTFDFEHKHGQLKHLFHGKTQIINQLLFNVDVSITLQLLYPQLLEIEDDDVISFLTKNRRSLSNMTSITYVVGKVKQEKLSPERSRVIRRGSARLFSRLYKNGILYYATEYSKGCTWKRDNSICAFIGNNDGEIYFGRIDAFLLDPYPLALLHCYETSSESLMKISGHCCRAVLEPHKEVDLLSSFITIPGEGSPDLIAVNLDNIVSKAVHIQANNKEFLILQPNNFECH